MVSSRGMLEKSESMSKLPMKLLKSYSTVSVAQLNESLIVYLLVLSSSKIGTKYFASLYVGVCKADKIGLKSDSHRHIFYALHKNHTLFQVYLLLVLDVFVFLRAGS